MKRDNQQPLPQSRRRSLIVQEFPGEVLIYDLERHLAHCLNHTAVLVWKYCDGKLSAVELSVLIEKKTGAPFDVEMVWLAVQQLARFRLLEDPAPEIVGHVSRRELVRRLGLGAAVALPLVTSIISPTAVMAATCGAVGTGCTTNARCCSTICMNGQCVCLGLGTACTASVQCCSPSICFGTPTTCCLPKGANCMQDSDCCFGPCTGVGSLKCSQGPTGP